MKIAFFIRHFGERGTEVAVYDYAHYNETLLGNESIIIGFTPETYAQHGLTCLPEVLEKFKKRFRVILVSSFSEIDPLLQKERVDVYHTLTHGGYENHPFGDIRACTYVVHCVFETRQPHGDVYCGISQQLNERFGTSIPVVPHLVVKGNTTETFRERLGISDDSIVFGRYGGANTFDIHFVREAVVEVAREDPTKFFLFMNTDAFCNLPNVIFLPRTVDTEEKQRFINTCDAYLHARSDGETFGLSIAEFAISDKPIICCTQCTDNAHLRILQDKVYTYTTKQDVLHTLRSFQRGKMNMSENGYKQFTAQNVMYAFRQIVCVPKKQKGPLSFLKFHG